MYIESRNTRDVKNLKARDGIKNFKPRTHNDSTLQAHQHVTALYESS